MSVADWSGSLLEWERELGLWKLRLGPVFGRREVRETGSAFLDGLLSGIARKTGWMMAEQAGLSRPWRMQALLGRSRWDPNKRAYSLVFCPQDTTLAELAGVAGLRWTIEACFQRAKDDLGLDHCEARSWHGWHRHISLVMAAAAFLAKLAADLRKAASGKENETSPNPPIAA